MSERSARTRQILGSRGTPLPWLVLSERSARQSFGVQVSSSPGGSEHPVSLHSSGPRLPLASFASREVELQPLVEEKFAELSLCFLWGQTSQVPFGCRVWSPREGATSSCRTH